MMLTGEMRMYSFRSHGVPPFRVLTVHGGPGAAGELESLARELGRKRGVIEPFQTRTKVKDQIEELRETIANTCSLPVVLLGHSWGAWLVYLLAAEYGEIVDRIILVGSGPFEEHYALGMIEKRLSRLDEVDRVRVRKLISFLETDTGPENSGKLSELGKLFLKSDCYDPLEDCEGHDIQCDKGIYERVWSEASSMRRSGELLEVGKKINCPVLAIHGDYDPHPSEGVEIPLSEKLNDFKFRLLEKCGHKPWVEKFAREEFFSIIEEELAGIEQFSTPD